MFRFTRTAAAASTAALLVTIAACGGTDNSGSPATPSASSTAATSSSSASTGAASSTAPSTAPSTAEPSTSGSSAETAHNAADITFAQMMIVHHQGAIEMATLAADRAASAQVKELAARIEAAQAPEIEQMTAWLQAWNADMPDMTPTSTAGSDMTGMDHGGMSGMGKEGEMTSGADAGTSMPGMMSDEQMQELTNATGAEFDRLFLELMIVHHQGAVEMVDTEIASGLNPAAVALANSIKTSQTAEIAEMQQLLQGL